MVLIVSHRDVSPSVGGVFPLFPMPQGLEDSSRNVRKEEFNEILNSTYVKESASDVRTCNMLIDCLCMEDADFVR